MGTTARTASERFADGALYPASRFTARARRAAYRVLLALEAVSIETGTATVEVQDAIELAASCVEGYKRFVVLMGTPGAGSKATLTLLSDDGSRLAFMKVAWTSTARALVRHEASLLPVAGEAIAPRLLGQSESESLSCIVVSPLAGKPVGLTASVPRELVDRTASNAFSLPVTEHPFVQALLAAESEKSARAIASLAGRDFPVLPTHGDAAPWNAIQDAEGVIRMFDWEYGRREGLPLTDVAHWSLQVGHLSLRMSARGALGRSISEVGRATGLSIAEAASICTLTALDVAIRLESEHDTQQAGWWRECVDRGVACAEGGEL